MGRKGCYTTELEWSSGMKREDSKWRLILRHTGVNNYENEEKVRTMVFWHYEEFYGLVDLIKKTLRGVFISTLLVDHYTYVDIIVRSLLRGVFLSTLLVDAYTCVDFINGNFIWSVVYLNTKGGPLHLSYFWIIYAPKNW